MKNKLSSCRTLTWFTQILGLCLMLSISCCDRCDRKTPGPAQSAPGTDQSDLVAETPTMTLTGPAERKGATPADKDITLTLQVTKGIVQTADYTLHVETVESYLNSDFTNPSKDPNLATTVASMDGKPLKELVTDETLKAGEQKNINIIVNTHSNTYSGTLYPIWGESAIFKFEILDKAGNVVVSLENVKWTTVP